MGRHDVRIGKPVWYLLKEPGAMILNCVATSLFPSEAMQPLPRDE
jgi:hypothetical protein